MAIPFCTDDIIIAINQSKRSVEGQITFQLMCRDRELLRTDFKGLEFKQNGSTIRVLQQTYLDKY